jgi:hypothetical protein
MVKVEIDTMTGRLGPHILRYIATFSCTDCFRLDDYTRVDNVGSTTKLYDYDLRWEIGCSDLTIEHLGEKIAISFHERDSPQGTYDSVLVYKTLTLTCDAGLSIVESFIKEALHYNTKTVKRAEITCHTLKGTFWGILNKIEKRPFDSIFIPEKNAVLADIHDFQKKEDEYSKFGIPYKRNYLFEGPPGTGKTSLIVGLASELNMDICMMTLGPGVDDSVFINAVSNVKDSTLFILEDVDCLFNVYDRQEEGNQGHTNAAPNLTFSSVLNVLDGLARRHRQITIMTTNNISKMDRAFMRPGRIDKVVRFGWVTRDQATEMIQHLVPHFLYDKEGICKFLEKIQKLKVPSVIVHKYLFENMHAESICQNLQDIDELERIYNNRDKDVINMYN